jgi:serine/threonine protein kinase
MADLLEDELQDLRWDDPLLRLALDVARGMAYLHGREYFDESAGEHKKCIIHRDLKPENCLISDFTSAKISDFGTSRAKAADDAVTMTAVGTPLFCAPEIVTAESYDEKCDVYSFGLFLLNMTTDKDIVEFIGDKWRTTFSKKKANMMKAIRCMQEEGWRPVTMEDPVGWAPPTINSLLVRCCLQDSRARPSFIKIIEDLQGPCALEIGGSKFLRHEQPTHEESSNKAHMDDGYHNSSNERKVEQQSSSKKDLGSEYSSEVELKAEQRLSQTAVNMVNPLRAVPPLGNDAQGKPDPHSGML